MDGVGDTVGVKETVGLTVGVVDGVGLGDARAYSDPAVTNRVC